MTERSVRKVNSWEEVLKDRFRDNAYYFINIIMNNSINQASWIYLWVPALGFCYEITKLLLLN